MAFSHSLRVASGNESQQIHDLVTYKTQRASELCIASFIAMQKTRMQVQQD